MNEFDKLVKELGPLEQRTNMSANRLKYYKGRVPESLLDFWSVQGFGCHQNGRDWVCNPDQFASIVTELFEGDPEFDPDDLVVIQRQSFANLTLWSRKLKGQVNIDFNFSEMTASGDRSWIDRSTGDRHDENYIVGNLFYNAKELDAFVDEADGLVH